MYTVAPNSVLAGRQRQFGPPAMPVPRSLVPRTLLKVRHAAHMPARSLSTAERPSPTRTQPSNSEVDRDAAEAELEWSQLETVNETADVKRQKTPPRTDLGDTNGGSTTSTDSTKHGRLSKTETSAAAMDADLRYLGGEEAHLSSELAQLSISTEVSASREGNDTDCTISGDTSSPTGALSYQEIERRNRISQAKVAAVPWNKGLGASKEVDGIPRKWLGLEPNELLRRQRQSKSAAGRVPWNKGLKHSAEVKAKISAGVNKALKNPDLIDRIRCMPKRLEMGLKFGDERPPQPKPKKEPKPRKPRAPRAKPKEPKAKPVKAPRAPKPPGPRSAAHNDAISAGITRKWQDPEYRARVLGSMNSAEYQSKRIESWRGTVATRDNTPRPVVELTPMELASKKEQQRLRKNAHARERRSRKAVLKAANLPDDAPPPTKRGRKQASPKLWGALAAIEGSGVAFRASAAEVAQRLEAARALMARTEASLAALRNQVTKTSEQASMVAEVQRRAQSLLIDSRMQVSQLERLLKWQTAAESAVFDTAASNGFEDLVGNSALLDALRPSSGASGDAIAAAAAVVAQAETQTGAAQAAPGPPEVSNSKSTPHLQEAAAAKAVGALQQSSQALHTAAPDPSSRPVDGKQLPPYEHNVDGGGPVNGLSPSQHQQQLSRASSSAEQLLQQHSASSAPIPTSGDQTPSSPGAKSAGALEAAADSPPTSRHVSEAVPKSREDAVRTDLATAAAAATQEQADGAAARAKSAAVAVAAAATAKTEAAPADGQVPEPQEIRWVWQNGKRVTA